MTDIEKRALTDVEAGGGKDDLAETSHAKQFAIKILAEKEVRYLIRRERTWFSTITGLTFITIVLLVILLCNVRNFYSIFETHAHLSQSLGSFSESLAPFVLLLTPTVAISTLFIISFVTTVRFITAYVKSEAAPSPNRKSRAENLGDQLLNLIEQILTKIN